ncbi:MAG: phosphotransferase, partial [Acidimicrobiales bacterium]
RKAGLPIVIPTETLDDMCQRYWQRPLKATWYAPISSWKGSSAAFLWLGLEGGDTRRVILKAARYTESQDDAYQGFPFEPGAPEFWIYNAAAPALRNYLADCMLAVRLASPETFLYVLEDLSVNYVKPPRVAGWRPGVLRMHDLHSALSVAAAKYGREDLLIYDKSFDRKLLSYAEETISRIHSSTRSLVAREVLDDWTRLSNCYMSHEFDIPQIHRPIHGDYNTGNLFVSKKDRAQLKVVDWEWTGFGLPHIDLASYLRRAPSDVTRWAIDDLARREPDLTLRAHERVLLRCALQRGIWDASLLASQLGSDVDRFQRLDEGVDRSLSSAMHALNRLAG